MLRHARAKAGERRSPLQLSVADALALPVPDTCIDVVTVAFGVRNFEDLEAGLRELIRVLRPGGSLVILEFSRPRGLLGPFLAWWTQAVPPRVGRMISGDPEAYDYLPASVGSFADPASMCRMLDDLGLVSVKARPLTWGVCTLYEGIRSNGRREAK